MNRGIHKIGYLCGLTACLFTVGFVVVQLLQLKGVLQFPFDEILIYGTSLGIVIPFLLAMLAFHYITPNEKKFWTHAALIFSVIYSVFVTANYVVQLATVIPMKWKGEGDDIRLLEQTPHSLFWDFDALGYMFMGLAMLIALPAFERDGFQKWVRLSFLANAAVTPLIMIVYFYPDFTTGLLFIGFPWGVTAPLAMLMLALMFKRNSKQVHD